MENGVSKVYRTDEATIFTRKLFTDYCKSKFKKKLEYATATKYPFTH